MTQLLGLGRQALNAREYERAAGLYREGVRRAPFRQDIKEWLAEALEGILISGGTTGRPSGVFPPSPARAPREPEDYEEEAEDRATAAREPERPATRFPERRPPDWAPQRDERDEPPDPEGDRRAPGRHEIEMHDLGMAPQARPRPTHAPAHPQSAHFRPSSGHGSGAPPPAAHRPGRQRPMDFTHRHQRGPLLALFMTGIVGLLLVGIGAGLFWGYQHYSDVLNKGGFSMATFANARANTIVQNANMYIQKGAYSEAIEQLQKLPEGVDKQDRLSKAFDEKGMQQFIQDPPNYKGAIEDYKQAVTISPNNNAYRKHLGEAYYRLGKERSANRKESMDDWRKAQNEYEGVLSREFKDLEALNRLRDVAIAMRDDALLNQALNRIIEAAPDSADARSARRELRERSFKTF